MKLYNIIQTEDTIKVSPHDTLSFALNKLSSAHDAAFVFSDKNKYLGVINPYYCVIKTSSPSNAKVEHALYHAPHVKLRHPVSKIAQLMIESKIHYLPVFDDKEEFVGYISARSLLRRLENLDIFTTKIEEVLSRKKIPLITVFEDDPLVYAMQKLKKFRVSKLVVVNKEMRLRGILSYYDLIAYLASPKKREKQDKSGDKVGLQSKSVRHFLKTYVLTLSKDDYLRDALHLILEKKIGSVVIVDGQNRPINIITTKDLLSLFVRESTKERIEVIFKKILRYDFYINSTNTKASIIIAWNGTIFGTTLIKYNSIVSLYRIPEWAYLISNILLLIIALSSLTSIAFIFQVINPFLSSNHKHKPDNNSNSLLFFGSIAKMRFDDYIKRESSISYEELLSDLKEQSYILATGLNIKMLNMRRSIKAIYCGMISLSILVLVKGVITYVLV